MKKMEERRPVMFMWWEVQEKPVPNCQDTKNPMKATWREERRDQWEETYPGVEGEMVDGGQDDEEDGGNGAADHAEHQQGRGQKFDCQED